jgi:hypothetical protein
MHEAVYRACCQHLGIMGREIDVGDGARMSVQHMLDGGMCGVEMQVPHQRLLV